MRRCVAFCGTFVEAFVRVLVLAACANEAGPASWLLAQKPSDRHAVVVEIVGGLVGAKIMAVEAVPRRSRRPTFQPARGSGMPEPLTFLECRAEQPKALLHHTRG